MKACLYKEVEQPVNPVDEKQLATADHKAELVDVPKQGLYLVNYKTLVGPTLIALAILGVWAVATWLL
ncbi:MAG: hypothetical protein KBT13_06710 [Bacteroidales bacterium]|uniref:hypothetical protein n=1 Tax=Sodaliphilus sp. TaxID=2815818 RepID=UPI001B4B3CDC|nr:hypothetical protein [Candidatus Sodaliphilus limicaballi]